ncbi:MAG TPA: exonuclease domain-containing protein [Patescibacteria group bacterium]|nr:exonuclease domain-containing protein [Patescibacteria group bacterium]
MFKNDILLVDLEMSGLNPRRHEILQLAGVLLDKKTLKEKKHFNVYITPKAWRKADPKSLEITGISLNTLKSQGKPLAEALDDFVKHFGKKVTIANWVGTLDKAFMEAAFEKTRKPYPFDYHSFDIWVLAAAYAAQHLSLRNKKRHDGFDMEDLIKSFKMADEGKRHDALSDCRYAAEILRQLWKRLKFKK